MQDPEQLTERKPASPLANLNVLLVEDTPDQQRLYLAMLRYAGAQVKLECNGQAAVTAAMKASPAFDVVIMDMAMPLLDGVAATRELRQLGYSGAILGFTAKDNDHTRKIWLRAGCDAYLAKPVSIPTFISAILELAFLDRSGSSRRR